VGVRRCWGVTAVFVLGATIPVEAPEHAAQFRSTTFARRGMPSKEVPPQGLTHEDWGQLRRAVEASTYHASRVPIAGEAPVLQASNRQQAYRTTFRPGGIEIVPRAAGAAWQLGVAITGYGYEGDVRPVERAQPQASNDRVEYHRSRLTEWYVNRPAGLEQGFELEEPESRRPGPLVVTMAVSGDLDVSTSDSGVSFVNRSGETLVRYAGLKAWDAEGRPLPSRLEAAGGDLRMVVDAQAARFPVTVDPVFIHEAQLFGHADTGPAEGGAEFGFSVAVDGDTAVVGAPFENSPGGTDVGSANVFVRSGTSWVLQQKLWVGVPQRSFDTGFGHAVAISGDTVVVGAPFFNDPPATSVGSAYVFVRSGTTWTLQKAFGPSDSAVLSDQFGYSVSISGDTVVVGAPTAYNVAAQAYTGKAYVFVRSGTLWSEQQKLLASDGAELDNFGKSVSVSADTAVIGADWDDTAAGLDAGSAYVFVRSGTAWTEQQHLLASDGKPSDHFGISSSVSADTTVVGAYAGDTPGGTDAGSAYVFVRSGTTWSEQQKLLASDGAASDHFGISTSISGDTIVAGARRDDSPDVDAGSAYVFVRSGSTWTEQQKLVASDAGPGDLFGYSVSVSGDTVVVGAYGDSPPVSAGSAYVLVRSGTSWTEQQKLLPVDTEALDYFGSSVSVSGDTVVVGAPRDDAGINGKDRGSAYVFVRSGSTWMEQQKLLASDGAASDSFGTSVSISGDTIVVGADWDSTPAGDYAGSAYVFVRSGTTWTEQQKLVASDATTNDNFGHSVSISGDTIVVGQFVGDTAYVFVRSGTSWTEQQQLVGSAGGGFFGNSVSISGDTVVAGAPREDTAGGEDAGAAYVFVRSGTVWTEQKHILASDGATDDNFGVSVSISGDTVVVGAFLDDTPSGAGSGSAYVFARVGTTWTEQQKLIGSDTASFDGFGLSVSVSGDITVVGAPFDDTPGGFGAGSAYVFVRAGTKWTEQQQLLAPDAASSDDFSSSVSASPDIVVVGTPYDDTPNAPDTGSVHVFRALEADLGVTKTDGQTTAVPGDPLTYTIVASNAGPDAVTDAIVTDLLPGTLLAATWTCSPSAGSACTASGSGSINDAVTLPVGGIVTYTVTGTVASGATGSISNMVTVTVPASTGDPDPANDSATDMDTLVPEADVAIAKADSVDPVLPGGLLTYTLTIDNVGPSDVTAVSVTDPLPAGVTFISSSPGPPQCTLAGRFLTCDLGALSAGTTTAVTIAVTVNAGLGATIVNTADVTSSEKDPDPVNNSASETTHVRGANGELTHGTDAVLDLAAQPGPVADQDVFLISQKPYSSYEIVVEGTSGDIGLGTGPLLQRIASDGTTALQDSIAIGAGPARSLRWRNTTSAVIEDQTVRVTSAQCGTDCGPDDVYRLRAYETTYAVPRFNNSGTQITVLILQNPTSEAIAGDIYFDVAGQQVAAHPFSLAAKATLVLDTSTVPGAGGVAGAITIAHDGRYGGLLGKTVAVEPSTGFSFDSILEPRPK